MVIATVVVFIAIHCTLTRVCYAARCTQHVLVVVGLSAAH